MKIAFFDTHEYERVAFNQANEQHGYEITFLEPRLTAQTVRLAEGFDCVCCFVNDRLDAGVLKSLQADYRVRLIALRSAGFNNVDLATAALLGIPVVRVPAYSPHAVAEHATALLLALVRKIHKAYTRVHELNFSLEGMVGFDLYGKTVGVVGTGRIGSIFAGIMKGFGCKVLAFDIYPSEELRAAGIVQYVDLDTLYSQADVVSLHVPLTPRTHHFINSQTLSAMKPGVVLINTGRGALIDTRALIDALKKQTLGGAALDVYEEEEGVFFEDLSSKMLHDDVLARLITFPNVLITSHQGFLTREALQNIAETTLRNIADFTAGKPLINQVLPEPAGEK